MSRIALFIVVFFIVSCGGDASETSAQAAAEPVEKANNPLAAEQQLIKDAEAIQGILNEDADRKKKALDDSN